MTRRFRAAWVAAALTLLGTSCSEPSTGPAPPAIPDKALVAPTADCLRSGTGPLLDATSTGDLEPAAPLWSLRFEDEFEGTALDTAVWNYRQEGLRKAAYGRGRAASDRRAVSVARGRLRLSAMVDPSRPGYFLNGHVSTEDSYTFREGIAAARIKFQQARGQHGAFWIQTPVPETQGGGPHMGGAEIDVAEFFGEGYPRGGLSHFVHYRGDDDDWVKTGGLLPRSVLRLPVGQNWWNSYHVFSVEWSPDAYVFRIDGRVTWCSGKGVSGVKQFLVLSLLNSDWELARLRPSRLPQTMSVDWVRVWQM